MILIVMLSTAQAADPLPERLAERATQPDVVLVPPVGSPSPKAGSFLIPYVAEEGQPSDPAREGTYEVGPSSCTDALQFVTVDANEQREELWRVKSGVGARLGLPTFGVQIGGGSLSMAGLRYEITEKLIVDGGLEELELCCLRSPEKCTDRYISEYWVGTGTLHKLSSSNGAIKTSLKQLDKLGKIDFGATKGWTVASSWSEPMYFAYRTSAFQAPSCESYMNDLPEEEDRVLFTGVSEQLMSEQRARRDAQEDARQQVVRYLGEELRIEGDEIYSRAEALLSGVKDSLTCIDTRDTPEGPSYLARVRMYVDAGALDEAMAGVESRSKR
ncbi:MAG TPA: hypothetical protein ENK18_09410 [Deltaproteobacteria bacterium]|nr:hypothetical protein [Deltaproteobacteria bacterium]